MSGWNQPSGRYETGEDVMTSAEGFTEEREEYTASAGILKITMPAFGAVVLHHKN